MDVADDDPEVVVDLSNVCRDRALLAPGQKASWHAFERVMAAWQAQIAPRPRGVAIADENLRFHLDPRDRRKLEQAERLGLVRVVGNADPEILRRAHRTGAAVLSADRFVGHRRKHPWIQGAADRFFAWTVDGDEVRIVALDMGKSTAYSLSRGEEADRLKERGLNPRRASDQDRLMHGYRCTNPGCFTAQYNPDRLLVPPARAGGRTVCPDCGGPLEDLGPHPNVVELVFELDGHELARRTVQEGETALLGRNDILDSETIEALTGVSREHVEVRVARSLLRIRDARSRNGTAIARWNSTTRTLDAPQPLSAGDSVELGHRDVVILGGTVHLRRSGQRFAVPTGPPAADPPARATTTTTEDPA